MANNNEIKNALRKITERNEQDYCGRFIVSSVDETAKTCYCESIDPSVADIADVQLIADNKTGFLIIPSVDSIVTISFLSNQTAYVSQFSKFDKMLLNGDSYGGLVQIKALVDKLNALEDWINKFTVIFNALTLPVSGSTAGPPASPLTDIFIDTTITELENKTVQHGPG